MTFFFTGTGNSLYAARQIGDQLFSIPQLMNSGQSEFADEKIGIVCPVYGHEMPQMVREFIARAAFHTDYLYVVLTYGKRHGNAVELAEQVFRTAGKRVDYIATLLMVDNFLPAFDMNAETKLNKSVDKQLEQIKSDIAGSKRGFQNVEAADRAIHQSYLSMVGNAPATVWADFQIADECVGCGICVKVCPAGCIRLDRQRAILHTDEGCQACYACIHACPQGAIQLNIPEKNARARYRHEQVALAEIIAANNQTEN